jgi:two-component system KDP operon response regulator KdpE
MIDNNTSLQVQPEIKSGLAHTQVLVADEDRAIRRYLRTSLVPRGYQVYDLDTPRSVLTALQDHRPHVLILDPQFSNDDGISIIAEVRKNWSRMPILVVSDQKDISFIVRVLDAGADDYVPKPFGIEELSARIRAAIRHAAPPNAQFSTGDLSVDLTRQIVRKNGQFIRLTPIEYELLTKLIHNAGIPMSSPQLSKSFWGDETHEHMHRLRVHMSNLRTKLETDPSHPELILTEPGFGYRLNILE